MTIHRPAHSFADRGADGVGTIGEACAQVMRRLEWNRMKWERGHSGAPPSEDRQHGHQAGDDERRPRHNVERSEDRRDAEIAEHGNEVDAGRGRHADHLRRVRRLRAIEASWSGR